MNARAEIITSALCRATNPAEKQASLHSSQVGDMLFHLRPVYIADDDLPFINRCTQGMDKAAATAYKEPYHTLALSDSGQAYILFVNDKPVSVVEVHHAMQYDIAEEYEPGSNDYLIRFFWAEAMTEGTYAGAIRFFSAYCSSFPEVMRLILVSGDEPAPVLAGCGYTKYDAEDGPAGNYYLLDLPTSPQT